MYYLVEPHGVIMNRPETKAKLAAASTGRKMSPEAIARRVAAYKKTRAAPGYVYPPKPKQPKKGS